MMAEPSYNDKDWVACPAGTLRSAAASMRGSGTATRRRFLAGVATGVVVAAVGLGAVTARQLFFPAHLTCHECQRLMARFADSELSPDLAARVQQHLRQCQACNVIYDSMQTVSKIQPAIDPPRQRFALLGRLSREAF